ncbi:aminoglycoside phosphotransferase [Luteimicrobium subarcticum]|uniref:aminoglycoside phosphotransferase n=1 Tax=Luteimicrobium subarcticum TaxID=620910 RepID=UPI001FE26FB4|nr:aminoglycoside phosphotransferase [Luteimicrobium subarcticum]
MPATLDDLLATWMPTRRWYPAKGSGAIPVPVAVLPLGGPEDRRADDLPVGRADAGVVVEAHLLRLTDPGSADDEVSGPLLHVPLVLVPADRAEPVEPPDPTALGTIERDGRSYVVHDGPAHAAYLAHVVGAATWVGDPVRGAGDLADARVIAGEQSNTSVILPRLAGGAILKVLRTVAPGPNPDLDVPRALAATGWDGVPAPLAWTSMPAAPGAGPDDEVVLTICSALVPGADDGFERACRAARDGVPFTADAAALGELVGTLRDRLRSAFGDAGPVDASWLVADLRARAARAVADAAPRLDDRVPGIARLHDALATDLATAAHRTTADDLPVLQRVHGDLHLGQVLHGDDGWRVLDFEGEPMRPVAQRTRPDLALRDAAGMLRSFDYAAAVGGTRDPGWAQDARTAFLDAYRAVGTDADGGAPAAAERQTPALDDHLLAALELDKALYEVVYEVRNRPAWVEIPLAGVDRLLRAT